MDGPAHSIRRRGTQRNSEWTAVVQVIYFENSLADCPIKVSPNIEHRTSQK